jgi:hypothetical protein
VGHVYGRTSKNETWSKWCQDAMGMSEISSRALKHSNPGKWDMYMVEPRKMRHGPNGVRMLRVCQKYHLEH